MRRLPPLLLVAAALMLSASPASACIKKHSVPIAEGQSPSGLRWSVEGSIKDNGSSCRDWLFGVQFEVEGEGNWGWGTGIPVGGHLSRREHVDAFDDLLEDGSDRVFGGTTSGETAKVVATLSDNKHLTIRPRSVPAPLRRENVWLRNLRYFVDYYPPTGFVTEVAAFDASGGLLYRDKNFSS